MWLATNAIIAGTMPVAAPDMNLAKMSCPGVCAYPVAASMIAANIMARTMLILRPNRSPTIPQIGANNAIPIPSTHPPKPAQNAARSIGSIPSS